MAAHIGRRLRKGAATTAVAAAAVAALSASQAPGVAVDDHGRTTASDAQTAPEAGSGEGGATGNSPYYTDLPPLNSPKPTPTESSLGTPVAQGEAEAGIPATVLDAYKKAEAELASSKPGCNLPWELLAAIGKVESGQARGGAVDANGTTITPILGPELDGNGFALIKDTDNGAYDGNSTYDQAVGPMQFIPSTWAWAGRDGNGDGVKDPNNVYDAALAAGHYLCRNGWDLSVADDLDRAILSYNNSQAYLGTVRSWLEYYRKGTHEVPDGTGSVPSSRSDDDSDRAEPTPSPTTPAKTKPTTPATPGSASPEPTPPASTPPTTTPPTTTPPAPTPTDTVDHLVDGGTAKLSARAGDTFAQKISAKAETKDGTAVGKVRVRFTIVGDTDTTFAGGESVATVVTKDSGVAVAPALVAGEKTGDVVVRATVVGRSITGLDYQATVTERVADSVARTTSTALTCAAGGEFAERVELKATYQGAAADNVAVTATVIKGLLDTSENDKGPYFKDADGTAVRTLTGLKTDAQGVVRLPKMYADSSTGIFLLRVTTAGGASRLVWLTVSAADVSPTPSATPSASASPSA
ncbi:lytic transglycosylase domain-containing protein [Streptomyces sp. NPDC087294]|uniref:lytic transglycosylase domain-containing protein n=1 Tax=Streptomyces sp. NPDC087294 TaxID=3365777 RepID=UPI00380321A7